MPRPTQATRSAVFVLNPYLDRFPANPFVRRLLDRAQALGIRFAPSPLEGEWLYHPAFRTIYLWEPDLTQASLSYLVTILAHELGHAIDFDRHPEHLALTHGRHWSQTPARLERAAFINGFILLQELQIPFELDAYLAMIAEPMARDVRRTLQRRHLCSLPQRRMPRTARRQAESAACAV